MASPAQLMQTISEATGVPLPTITDIDRRLVMAGLRTKGGRGLNAAQMTPLDAARLLTGVLASPQSNQAVDAVERYAQTKVDKSRSSETLFAETKIGDLAALPAKHGFIDALAALIASASTGSLAALIAQSKDRWIPHIEIFAFTRATHGRIRLSGLRNGTTASLEYLPALSITKAARAKSGQKRAELAEEATGDLEQSRRITERTIIPVARLLA